jgi:hypothetical protein
MELDQYIQTALSRQQLDQYIQTALSRQQFTIRHTNRFLSHWSILSP